MGKLSIAKALHNNKVDNKRCFWEIIGWIFYAYLISSSVPPWRTSSNYSGSIELYPTVKPDIIPAKITRRNE